MFSTEILREGVEFQDAIDLFRSKIELPTATWTDLWEGQHQRAFVVAGAMKSELLSDLRAAVDKAIADGVSIGRFRKDFDEIVERHGWSYKGGRNWRTSVIYNTNLRTAYQAGHYKQMTDEYVAKRRPFWRYTAVMDGRTRPLHKSWHNRVLPIDSPWWKTHYPPNGWGCRCTVVSHSKEELDQLVEEGETLDTTEPEVKWVDKVIKGPGGKRTVRVPEGIDPGWAYNVGETAWGRTEALRLMEDTGPWRALDDWGPERYGLPEKLPVDIPRASLGKRVPVGDETGLRSALREALGADEVALTDPTGEIVLVGSAIVDHILEKPESRWDGREAYFPLIPELIEVPAEIWVGFAVSELSGRVAIRRRYVKFVELPGKTILGAWAEIQNGLWVAGDSFRGQWSGARRLRIGRLLYSRTEEVSPPRGLPRPATGQ